MTDNRRLYPPIVRAKPQPTSSSAVNLRQTGDLLANRTPTTSTYVPPANISGQNITTSLPSVPSQTKIRVRESSYDSKTPKGKESKHLELLMYGLTRIINKKMYEHFFLIREQKRKRAFKKPFYNLLQLVEKSKTNYLKSMAWIYLLRNLKQKNNEGVGKTSKLIDRAYESTQRRLLMALRRRCDNLKRIGFDRIRKKMRKVAIMSAPALSLGHLFTKKTRKLLVVAFEKINQQGIKKKYRLKNGIRILTGLFRTKKNQFFQAAVRSMKSIPVAAVEQIATPAASRVNLNKSRVGSATPTVATMSTPRKVIASSRVAAGPTEDQKLTAQLEQLNRDKEQLNAKTKADVSAANDQIAELQRQIQQQKARGDRSAAISPTKSFRTNQSVEKDDYFQLLRSVYDYVRNCQDSIRKRDIIKQFGLDLQQLETTVEYELDKNQQLKDEINYYEDFLCPDQGIQRPEMHIDQANRLLEHENSQLRKVLQRYLVEAYGKNLLQEARKCYDRLDAKLNAKQ